MVAFFDSIEVAPGVHANGRMTLGENIADHGGLQVSYQAFKKATAAVPLEVKDGFTPEQRFFLAYANVWANNTRHGMRHSALQRKIRCTYRWQNVSLFGKSCHRFGTVVP